MEEVISTERLPIKLWLEDMEEEAMRQARNLANLPFAFKHIAIMPDSHQGYGMPIGGILATRETVVPNAVGVDIGCGMCALRTDLWEVDFENLKRMMGRIRKAVPVGFSHHESKQDDKWMPAVTCGLPVVEREYEKARQQIGTLGGGNHFIEIQQSYDSYVWIMVHSGSRNLGYTVAKHYHELAAEQCRKWHSEVPEDLAYFPSDNEHYDQYINEMTYCIEFARQNRKLMMERVKEAFREVVPEVTFSSFINKPHNFADREQHFGEEVMVHRKGATRVREGELGMIPGSQGANSYIVRGKGHPMAFESCSHGAGRVMSRRKAKRTLCVEEEAGAMEKRNILHAIRGENDLDEAPGCYKDICKVMGYQQDLVDVEVGLEPLAVIKG